MAKTATKPKQQAQPPDNEPKLAADKDDPLIAVQIYHRGLTDGTDFPFVFRRPAKLDGQGKVVKRYSVRKFRLISGGKHELPLSVVEHLEKLAHPITKYVAGAAEGKSMQQAGMRYRFVITRLGPAT